MSLMLLITLLPTGNLVLLNFLHYVLIMRLSVLETMALTHYSTSKFIEINITLKTRLKFYPHFTAISNKENNKLP